MKELPEFLPTHYSHAHDFIARAVNRSNEPEETCLVEFISYQDHHFRAIFRLDYFTIPEGQSAPSKSQWNTLKKRIKRMNPSVFIFKDYGEITTEEGQRCGYIEFGYLPA